MSRLLRPFGHGGGTIETGQDLSFLIGYLEALASDEEDNVTRNKGPKARRLELVQDAVAKLYEACEMGDEDR